MQEFALWKAKKIMQMHSAHNRKMHNVFVVFDTAPSVCGVGLRNGRVSVRPSVCCPVIRPQQRRAAGLLLSARTVQAGYIDRRQRRAPYSNGAAVNAGIAMLTAELTRLNTELLYVA